MPYFFDRSQVLSRGREATPSNRFGEPRLSRCLGRFGTTTTLTRATPGQTTTHLPSAADIDMSIEWSTPSEGFTTKAVSRTRRHHQHKHPKFPPYRCLMLLPCKRRPPSGPGEPRIAAHNQMSRVSRQPKNNDQQKNKSICKDALTRPCGLTFWLTLFAARHHRYVSPTRTSSSVLVHTRLIWNFLCASQTKHSPRPRALAGGPSKLTSLACVFCVSLAGRETGRTCDCTCACRALIPHPPHCRGEPAQATHTHRVF